MDLVDALHAELAAAGDPARAAKARDYLKRAYDVHFGVDVPTIRAISRRLADAAKLDHDALVDVVARAWARGPFELRAAAAELLIRHVRLVGPSDVPLLEHLLRTSRTWALLDTLAEHVVGPVVERSPELGEVLDRWSVDPDFWLRRASMLALLGPLRKGGGDFARFSRYADAMLHEKEFFVRKAIGWVLREVSKKRPELVVAWVRPRASRMSGLTLREATRRLPP